MMYLNVVYASTVDIECLAKVFHTHCRALDMPARVTTAPGAVPLHYVSRLIFEPEHKVVLMLLLTLVLHSPAGSGYKAAQIKSGKFRVGGKRGCIKIHRARSYISASAFDQSLNKSDHIRNMFCCPAYNLGPFDIELLSVVKERALIFTRNLPYRKALARSAPLQFILALIGV